MKDIKGEKKDCCADSIEKHLAASPSAGKKRQEKAGSWKGVAIALGGASVILLGSVWFSLRDAQPAGELDQFAQCLQREQATMYGAEWCPHCQKEKKAFGDSFRFVPYVECPDDPKLCLDKGIKGYPTWVLKDGRKLVGEQGLKGLSEATGCSLPQ